MKCLIVLSALVAVAFADVHHFATPGVYKYSAVPYGVPVSSQFHSQDDLGQYSYGYSGGPSAKTEYRSVDGSVAGGYSYVDPAGEVQSVKYTADAVHGFRVAATNLPVAPVPDVPAPVEIPTPVEDTPEVTKARAEHLKAVEEVKNRKIEEYITPVVAPVAPLAYAAPVTTYPYSYASYAAPEVKGYAYSAPAYYPYKSYVYQPEAKTFVYPETKSVVYDTKFVLPEAKSFVYDTKVVHPEFKSFAYDTAFVKPETKSIVYPEFKTYTYPEVKTYTHPELKSYEVKTYAYPEVKSYAYPEVKAYAYPEYKTFAYPEYKTYAYPEYKTYAYSAPTPVTSQFHSQDEAGQYSYGYAGGLSSKTEVKSLDGVTRGGYSYVDANNVVQSVQYTADDVNGFRVAATNLPSDSHVVAPVETIADTPEVVEAKAAHFAAHIEAKERFAKALKI